MKKRQIAFLLLLFPAIVFANGGPMDWSTILQTGNMVMKSISGVRITKEKIDAKIEGDFTTFDVVYTLRKNTHQKEHVLYGFPVDYSFLYTGTYFFDKTEVPYFNIYFQNKPLPVYSYTYSKPYEDSTMNYSYKRKWYFSRIYFNQTGDYELRVKYKLKNNYEDLIFSKSIVPKFRYRDLRYDFTPASGWGNGIIDTFNLRIDASSVLKNEGDCFLKISKSEIKWNQEGLFEYSKYRFHLSDEGAFYMRCSNEIQVYSSYILKCRLPNKLIKDVKCGFESESENLNNLTDLNFISNIKSESPVEVEKSWVEYIFKNESVYSGIEGVYFLNGDYSNKKAFYASNRIKKIKVDIEGLIPWGEDRFKRYKKISFVKTLPFHKYRALNKSNFAYNLDLIVDYKDSDELIIKKIRITVLEVTGDKQKGFTMPEIIFYEREKICHILPE